MKKTAKQAQQNDLQLQPIATIGKDNDGFFGAGFQFNNVINASSGNDTTNTIFGANDQVDGGSGDDSAITGAGNDQIKGGTGNEFVLAGSGDDTIDGGDDNDLLNGDDFLGTDPGSDKIQSGDGNDYVDAGGGNDTVFGGDGFDRITGEAGDDQLFGDGDDDVLTGAPGNDLVQGGDGNDVVLGFEDNDQVYGDDGNDIASGGSGNDAVFGGKGNDVLIGFDVFSPIPFIIPGEVDTLTGGEGNDTFVLGRALPGGVPATFYTDSNPTTAGISDYALIADFGKGSDRIQLVGSASSYVLGAAPAGLPSGTGIFLNEGTPELIGIVAGVSPNQLSLTNANQFVFVPATPQTTSDGSLAAIAAIGDNEGFFGAGFQVNNVVNAGAGNDTINTIFGADDQINGGSGDDSAITGPGNDQINGGSGDDFVLGGSGNDIIDGGDGNDFLLGEGSEFDTPGNDQIRGGAGNDYVEAGGGDDIVFGGAGFDRITGSEGADQLFGEGGSDVLTGAEGNDIVHGGAGDDVVLGFADNDQVFGDDGDDVVVGGVGNDAVLGGKGKDLLIGFDIFSGLPFIIPGEVDTLTGGKGHDTFALGTTLPGGNKAVFYTDSDSATAGTADYALIADFGFRNDEQNHGRDKIQLIGSANQYVLGAAPSGSPQGTAIFLNDGATPELLGIVANVSPDKLSLTNTSQFTFI